MIGLVFLILLAVNFCQYTTSSDPKFDLLNSPVNSSNFISYFAICAVLKNEREDDVREWIDYHYKMGVGKFYLHDNGDVPLAPMVKDWVERGIVSVKERKDKSPQLSVYHRCLRNYRLYHQWIAFIDADEFVVTKQGCSIPSVMKRYEPYGGLTLNWMSFGSSNHITRPPGGILKNYWSCFMYEHVKSVANTNYGISHQGNPHVFTYSHDKYAVDTDFFKLETPVNLPRPSLYENIYLNHYHLKSKEDYDRNRKRGRASTTEPSQKNEAYFWRINALCNRNCTILQPPATYAPDCPLSTFTNLPLDLE